MSKTETPQSESDAQRDTDQPRDGNGQFSSDGTVDDADGEPAPGSDEQDATGDSQEGERDDTHLTITFSLDGGASANYAALKSAGIQVEALLGQFLLPDVEDWLHDANQTRKYDQQQGGQGEQGKQNRQGGARARHPQQRSRR